jgi:hypothetical protein
LKAKLGAKLGLALWLVLLPAHGLADETIEGHYCYTYGDNESLREARDITRTLAVRNAIESFGVYVVSTMTVKDFVLTDDLVNTISTGYLKNIEVLEHTEKGRTICDTIQGRISPDDVKAVINQELSKRTPTGSPTKEANNGCLEIVSAKKWYNEVKVVVKVLKPTGALVSEADLNAKPCFRVLVDFFDSDGGPLGGAQQFIHNSPNEMLPGQLQTLYFELPYGTETYKAWLAP